MVWRVIDTVAQNKHFVWFYVANTKSTCNNCFGRIHYKCNCPFFPIWCRSRRGTSSTLRVGLWQWSRFGSSLGKPQTILNSFVWNLKSILWLHVRNHENVGIKQTSCVCPVHTDEQSNAFFDPFAIHPLTICSIHLILIIIISTSS